MDTGKDIGLESPALYFVEGRNLSQKGQLNITCSHNHNHSLNSNFIHSKDLVEQVQTYSLNCECAAVEMSIEAIDPREVILVFDEAP